MKKQLTETNTCAVSLFADCFLAAIKMLFGRLSHSSALFSDGVHSCADAFASLLTLIGVMKKKKADKKEKYERLTLNFICIILTVTGLSLLIGAVKGIILHSCCEIPSLRACFVSIFSLGVKEALFHFSRYASKKTGSAILYAQAWHHRSDALSCAGSFVGIVGAVLGFPVLDKAAGMVISLMIIKTAAEIYRREN